MNAFCFVLTLKLLYSLIFRSSPNMAGATSVPAAYCDEHVRLSRRREVDPKQRNWWLITCALSEIIRIKSSHEKRTALEKATFEVALFLTAVAAVASLDPWGTNAQKHTREQTQSRTRSSAQRSSLQLNSLSLEFSRLFQRVCGLCKSHSARSSRRTEKNFLHKIFKRRFSPLIRCGHGKLDITGTPHIVHRRPR